MSSTFPGTAAPPRVVGQEMPGEPADSPRTPGDPTADSPRAPGDPTVCPDLTSAFHRTPSALRGRPPTDARSAPATR